MSERECEGRLLKDTVSQSVGKSVLSVAVWLGAGWSTHSLTARLSFPVTHAPANQPSLHTPLNELAIQQELFEPLQLMYASLLCY